MGRRALVVAVCVTSTLGGTLVTAGPVQAHSITCVVTPYQPGKMPEGTIRYGGNVNCNDSPDSRLMTFRLWRWDGSRYFLYHETARSDTSPPNFTFTTVAGCSSGRQYSWHTEIQADGFHHNWAHWYGNSREVTLVC